MTSTFNVEGKNEILSTWKMNTEVSDLTSQSTPTLCNAGFVRKAFGLGYVLPLPFPLSSNNQCINKVKEDKVYPEASVTFLL